MKGHRMQATPAARSSARGALALAAASAASAHARISPPVSLSKHAQLYSLAVPTEKEGVTTTKIVLTVPRGSRSTRSCRRPAGSASSSRPAPARTPSIQKVTWTGGAASRPRRTRSSSSSAQAASTGTYTFQVEQTYSDGSIVNWTGPESGHPGADDRGQELARRRRNADCWRSSRSSSGPSACSLGGARARRGRRGRRGSSRDAAAGRGVLVALAAGRWSALGAAGRGVGARLPGQDVPVGERRGQRPAPGRRTHLRRSGRAAVRAHLGHRQGRAPGDDRARCTDRRPNPDTLIVPLRPHLPEGWYLVYWRAISVDGHPVQGAFTFAVGPNPGPAPQFDDPLDLPDGDDAAAARRPLGVFLTVMRRSACSCCGSRSPGRWSGASTGASLRAVSIAFVVASVLGADRDPGLPRRGDRGFSLRSAFDVGELVPLFRDDGVRPRLRRPRALLRPLLRRAGSRSGSTGRSAPKRSIAELLAGAARSPRRPRCCSCRARPAMPRRPRRAASR